MLLCDLSKKHLLPTLPKMPSIIFQRLIEESTGPLDILLIQYLTLWDLWNSLRKVNHAALLYCVSHANTRAADDKFDSFFELDDQSDSFSFLQWCGQYRISMKRLVVQISIVRTDNILTQENKTENLLKLVEKYLKKFGSAVLAVSLKFTFNCTSAFYFIQTVFKHCPNLIMLSLNAPMLNLNGRQAMEIIKEVTKCPTLRDWVFVGDSPFVRYATSTLFLSFCSLLKTMLGEDNVHQLFLSRTQRRLQPCQHTLGILQAMVAKKQLRFTRITGGYDCPWFHDMCFGMARPIYIFILFYSNIIISC